MKRPQQMGDEMKQSKQRQADRCGPSRWLEAEMGCALESCAWPWFLGPALRLTPAPYSAEGFSRDFSVRVALNTLSFIFLSVNLLMVDQCSREGRWLGTFL